ncbi:MAG: hypothetical protein ACFE8N_13215 [Promethearchaeota archaeon]
MENDSKARVFISCGQTKGTDEVTIAHKISDKLKELDFNDPEPYIAVEEQTLQGVKENIFQRLSESEYFIFVDFKREQLNKGPDHRGSLFSHQELALASFLNIETIGFREKGVKKLDGISRFIQSDFDEFTDRNLLPKMVADEVKRRRWNSHWRNELVLEREPDNYRDAWNRGKRTHCRWYHINLKNLHQHRMARECHAYIEKIRNINTDDENILELVELKWSGVKIPRVSIPHKSYRKFDAFYVYHNQPLDAQLGINEFITDSSRYVDAYLITGPCIFDITYVVFSENFSASRATFRLELTGRLDSISFSPI